jgi:hypothetical protein
MSRWVIVSKAFLKACMALFIVGMVLIVNAPFLFMAKAA